MRIDGRLLTAILLSTLGVALTYSYYRATAPTNSDNGDVLAIALVSAFDGRHQSRREASQFWAPVQQGDQLFPGDTIRTGETGDLQIRFLGLHQTLDIEPDTTVVITNPGDAPTLELLQGHLSVASTGEAQGPTLQLKTDSGVVAMSDPHSVISKEGAQSVSVQANTSVSGPNTFGIEWKEPQGDVEGTLNPEAPKPFVFKWAQKPEAAAYRVAVEWGMTRKKLDHQLFVQTPGEIKAALPLGRSFWRWSIYRDGDMKPLWSSASARVVLKGLFPPAIIAPANAVVLHLKELKEGVAIKWTPNERFAAYRVEIAEDPAFKKTISDQKFEMGADEFAFTPPRVGTYQWRISGQEAASQAWITSRTRSFVAQTKLTEKTDIQWVTQADKSQLYVGEKPFAELAWAASNSKAVKSYRVRSAADVEGLAEAKPQSSAAAQLHLPVEQDGTYVAQIEALNSDNEVIGQSTKLEFKVAPLPLLRAPSSIGGPQLKANLRGQVRLEWQPVVGASQYSVELTDPTGKPSTLKTASTSQVFSHLRPGTYQARLTTIDSHGRPGPQSEPTSIIVSNQSAVKTIHIKKMEVK